MNFFNKGPYSLKLSECGLFEEFIEKEGWICS